MAKIHSTDPDARKDLGARMQAVRVLHRINQSAAAGLLGLSLSHYSKFENGLREPKPEVLNAFGEQFGVSVDWLKTGEGDMRRGWTDRASEKVDSVRERGPGYGRREGGPRGDWHAAISATLDTEHEQIDYALRALGVPLGEVLRKIGERIEKEGGGK